MNIIFANKTSAACWTYLLRLPQHQKALMDFLHGKMLYFATLQGFSADGPLINCSGEMLTLGISAGSQDVNLVDGEDGRPYPLTKYFDWHITSQGVDDGGYPQGEVVREVTGGFMNHGTFEEPEWLSHT